MFVNCVLDVNKMFVVCWLYVVCVCMWAVYVGYSIRLKECFLIDNFSPCVHALVRTKIC
jgi:hypothetical protein